ncbi:dienelactone hydrolase family protein [Paractinoplanes rishiriensis]|uniref:Serine aminopeptidase S33 domain-containing protein n=1 Tax=Paractinoplanes rishiriensis TaxID=1050105 RepID=A0A919JWQ1_9ACTN|nr:alpha/beta fold hydrolase [Actinoplanes rishiriensis]GIE96601.1 hypothetical protein Ari01nite_40660 [Actinoplanes rishiriensis]
MRIDRLTSAAVLVILVAAGVGAWLLTGAGGDAERRQVTVAGVPLDEVHPPAGGRRPGVVVAHGFAGSAKLMAQFGDSLAARGYVVVLLDFSGHGANTRPLPDSIANTDDSTAALQRDLDVAVGRLRGLPDVDPARIALVGHSMGASAVTRYAVAHPDITATVAISLPSASALADDRPSRLLMLVGALEFPGFHAEAERAAQLGGPDRSLVTVPAVEHISILYAQRTHRETVEWLDRSFGMPAADGSVPSPVRRLSGSGFLLLALVVGLYPVGRLVLGGTVPAGPRPGWGRLGRTVVLAGAATVVAALTAVVLPTNRLPLAVANYVIGYTAVAGALLVAYGKWFGSGVTTTALSRRRLALATPLLVLYAAVTIAVPVHLGLTNAVPVSARWWLLPLVWAGFAVLALGAEKVTGGSFAGVLAVYAVAVVVLTAAAVAGLTHGFIMLVVPLLAVLLLWQAVWSAVLHRLAAPTWLIATVGALIVAWPIVCTLPVSSAR